MICNFPQNSFQRISVIFCLLAPHMLKIAFSTMDLLYNRAVLYNRIKLTMEAHWFYLYLQGRPLEFLI